MVIDDVDEIMASNVQGSERTPVQIASGERMEFAGTILDDRTERIIGSEFLATTSQSVLNQIISSFIEATSNEALKIVVCGSCARETSTEESEEISLEDIPNKNQLIPYIPHAAHLLVNGLLIYGSALGLSKETMNLCNSCRNQLKKDVRPSLSLANEMWIGEIPRELQNLTLPERLLLAKYYPCAYIVKLFPKQKNASTWDRSQLHSGLKGNVSTYRLDSRKIAHMIDGSILPPPARILSATIGITFVGPKGLRESMMPAFFRVRRWRVREGLLWLKSNNPLYQDIEISEENLLELPEDGIPDELMMTAKHNTDSKGLDRESGGYVPTDAEDDMGSEGKFFYGSKEKTRLNFFNQDFRQASFLKAGLIDVDEGVEEDIGNAIQSCDIPNMLKN